jgi:protein-S-isoprenylcysteine O-methyltransferase Ste14
MSTTPTPGTTDSGDAAKGCPIRSDPASRPARSGGRWARTANVLYGAVAYAVFLVVFVYLIGFVTDIAVPRSVNRAIEGPVGHAVVVDLALVSLFAVQHSVMARPAFKKWWTRYVPEPVERSTYVLVASAVLALLCWQWRSIDAVMWSIDAVPLRIAVTAVGLAGWAVALASTFMIDHFELFGLRQVIDAWRAQPGRDKGFRTALLYRLVRHPLMLGFLIAFWAVPTMTAGHLLFSAGMTIYILIATQLEERDLVAALGNQYRDYRRRVSMLVPVRLPSRRHPAETAAQH